MNDTVKWILAVFITAVAFYAGSEVLGFDWITFQASILAFVRMIGTLLLLFTGSAAAIEIARYYHRRNEDIDRERSTTRKAADQLPEAEERVTRSELETMLMRTVSEAVRNESNPSLFDLEPSSEESDEQDRPKDRRQRS